MLKESEIKKIQEKINYRFANKKLLQQAFTRKSYSAVRGGADNEVLEFYGDRILDLAVIRDFHERFGKINNKDEFSSLKTVGELCKMDIELVKNSHLAEQITRLGFTKYIQVLDCKEKFNMKNKADLFEAIIGAVALDSDWNLAELDKVYNAMMVSYGKAKELLSSLVDDYIDSFETLIWRHQICKTENKYVRTKDEVECSFVMMIFGKPCKVSATGKTDHLAKSHASEIGYKIIRLIVENEFIKNETYSEQLYFLYKNEFCAEPDFHFEFFPADSQHNEDLWRCFGTFPDNENEVIAEDTTMFDSKEQVAYALLCQVLGIEMEDVDIDDVDCVPDEDEQIVEEGGVIRGQGLLKYILSKYGRVA